MLYQLSYVREACILAVCSLPVMADSWRNAVQTALVMRTPRAGSLRPACLTRIAIETG